MDKKSSDDLVYSKVLIQKLVEHKDMFGVPDSKTDLQLMPLSEYRELVKNAQRLSLNFRFGRGLVDSKAARDLLGADAQEFKRALDELGKAPISTPAIRTQLDLAQGQWVFVDAAVQRQTDKRGLEAVATTSERLLEVMNRLTDLYEVELKDVLG